MGGGLGFWGVVETPRALDFLVVFVSPYLVAFLRALGGGVSSWVAAAAGYVSTLSEVGVCRGASEVYAFATFACDISA